ncbi:hypothetical protein D9615_000353 [Tricholomella constricta]|uniref:Glutathione S-transferase n=1 Tax=Tricholomella constricta TaxID=117010 RepID=A0A8H5MBH9_9AGAR|nr:hypothetical protein D9615_000353 [Tricholomella constricta]
MSRIPLSHPTMSTSTKPFVLYTAPTPNGFQASVLLEELKTVYPGIDYDVEKIDISKNVQKEPWFIKLNPNGRIPVLVDRQRDNFPVFETAAILLYLSHNYDKDMKFWYDPVKSPSDYSELLQWIFFAHGGVGPMQGQGRPTYLAANHFNHSAPEDIPYAKKRYLEETKRLYGVLEIRLTDRDWLVGPGRGKYTIADVKAFPWVRVHAYAGIESLDEWPNVKAWLARAIERPAAQAGLQVGK